MAAHLKAHVAGILAALMLLSACGPAPTPTAPPPAPSATPLPSATLPATWTPTDTGTPPPPTPTWTLTPSPTPLDAAQACADFVLLDQPLADALLGEGDFVYFVWEEPPKDTQVRLVIARPRAFNVVRVTVQQPIANNGIVLPVHQLPFSGLLYWQLRLLHQGAVICRLDGQMRIALPDYAALFTTPTATSTPAPTDLPTATPAATRTATATPTPSAAPEDAPNGGEGSAE